MLKKTDAELQRDVMDELEWEPRIDHAEIGVAVTAGVVTLSGSVKTYAEKIAAEKAVRRVAGVRAIAEEIRVHFASEPTLADHEVAKRLLDMMAWTVSIPTDTVKVKVERGWVTLSGAVDWDYQRKETFRAASRVKGVAGVTNLIEVKQHPTPLDVKDRIVSAFKRQADLDAAGVTVSTDGGIVKLGGKVRAWPERGVAERAAWSAPGVTRVEDNIAIAL